MFFIASIINPFLSSGVHRKMAAVSLDGIIIKM